MTSSSPGKFESSLSAKSIYRTLPRSVWILGFVSMFMDISSELVHSLLPVFMATVLGVSMVTRSNRIAPSPSELPIRSTWGKKVKTEAGFRVLKFLIVIERFQELKGLIRVMSPKFRSLYYK